MTHEPLTTELNAEDVHGVADVVDSSVSKSEIHTVVGLLAYSDLAAQMRLAIDAARAPHADYRFAQSQLSGEAFNRLQALISYLDNDGIDGQAQVKKFNNSFDEYEQRTKAETWHERVLKGYVGHAVSIDFGKIVMRGLPADVQDVVSASLSTASEAEVASKIITDATAQDEVLASRLALWGRRLAGEALNQIQLLVAQHPDIAKIVQRVARAEGAEVAGDTKEDNASLVTSWVFSQLTADHARRMDKIGLAS